MPSPVVPSRRLILATGIAALLSFSGNSSAQTYQWDPGADGDGSVGGTGEWNLTDIFWSPVVLDPVAADNIAWPNLDTSLAVFGGTGAGPFTVTLGASVMANGLSFETNNYTITNGGDLTRTLTLAGASPSINVVTAGHTATLSTIIAGTSGLNKTGAGTLLLNAANTLIGNLNVSGGTLAYTVDGNLGDVNNDLFLSDGATLAFNGGTQHNPAPTRVINIGTGGATIGGSGSIRLDDANQLAGSGTLTRAGNSNVAFDVIGNNPGFTGNVVVNSGVLESRTAQALGTGAGQTVTLNGGELAIAGVPLAHAVNVTGGRLSFHNLIGGTVTGNVTAGGDFTVSVKDWYQNFNRGGALNGTLSGNGNINVTGATTALIAGSPSSGSLLLRGNNTGYNGTLTVNAATQVRAIQGTTTDGLGAAAVILNGGTLGISPEVTAAGSAGNGFFGRYYASPLFNAPTATPAGGGGVTGGFDFGSQPVFATRTDATINYANNASGWQHGIAGLSAVSSGGLWTGTLNVSTGGTYTFFTNSDDGSQLWIDGQQIVQSDFSQGQVERNGVAVLSPGFHSVVIKYGQGTGGAAMQVNYQGPDTSNAKSLLGSVANSLTNNGANLFGSSTLDNDLTVTASSTIDLAGTNATSAGALTLNSGANLTVTGLTGFETFTQTGPVTLNGAHTIQVGQLTQTAASLLSNASAGADAVISGNITGGTILTKAGTRTLTLTGANDFSNLVISGGTVVGRVGSIGSGDITNNGALVLDQATDAAFAPAITGTGAVTKAGAGTLTLANVSASGPIAVNAGRLNLTSSTGTGTLTVNDGAALGGGSIAGPITVNAGGTIVAESGSTLNVGNLTFATGSQLDMALGAPSLTPLINSTGALAVGYTVLDLTNAGGLSSGTFRLIDYAGAPLSDLQASNIAPGIQPAGFFTGIRNNVSATALDLLVETQGTANTWSGATSGVWDTATSTNWTGGAYADGQRVTFNDSGSNKTVTGPSVAPQQINVTNSTGNDYTIANAITGNLLGGIVKNGTGAVTFTGANTTAGPVVINGGTLNAQVGGAGRTIGTGPITLGGGTLSLTPIASATPGLNGAFYVGGTPANTSGRDFGLAPVATRIESNMNSTWTVANPPGAGVGTPVNNDLTQFGGQFTGKYFVPVGGLQTFAISSDDSSRLFIDGVPVIINEGGQGGNHQVTGTINLSAGYHDIRVQYNQGTGGGNLRLYTTNGTSINGLTTTDTVALGGSVTVESDSVINLAGSAYSTGTFASLAQNTGTKLTVTGEAGKQVEFGGFVAVGIGTLTLDNALDVKPGLVAAPGVTLVKQGSGRLVLDNSGAIANSLTGSTVEVQAGKLVVSGTSAAGANNPLGSAVVNLNGGGLVLDSKFNGATYANSVILSQDARIESIPSTSSITLGSTGNTFTIGANDLTVDTYAGGAGSTQGGTNVSIGNSPGSTLVIASPIVGTGDIVKVSTALNRANLIQTNYNPGQLTLTANSPDYSGTTVINGGAVQANGANAASARPLGTGQVVINTQHVLSGFAQTGNPGLSVSLNPSLLLKTNSTGNHGTTVFGNALVLQGTGTQVTIDVNNNGANSNAQIQLGQLTVGGGVNRLNVTGGNNFYLSFDPASTTSLPASGFTVNANTAHLRFGGPVNTAGVLTKIGGGVLRLDGNNSLGGLDVRGGTLAITNPLAVPSSFGLVGSSILTNVNSSAVQLAGANGSFVTVGDPNTNALSANFLSNFGIKFDNSLGNPTAPGGRWGDAAPLALRAPGTAQDSLLLTGASGAAGAETVGAITYDGGVRVRLAPLFTNQNAILTAASLTRVGRGTLDIATGVPTIALGANNATGGTLGAATAGSRLVVTAAPARGSDGLATVSMVTPTIANASTGNFVDYAPGDANGFKDVTYTTTDLNASAVGSIVNSAAVAVSGNRDAYALRLTGALTSSTAGTGRTVRILGDQSVSNDGTAGLILHNGTNFTANNADVKLVFGTLAAPREAVVLAQAGNHTFGGPVLANGLTKHGDSALILSADQTRTTPSSGPFSGTVQGLEGDIVVNRGIISLRQQNGAGKGGIGTPGTGTTRIILAGGTLETRLDTATTFGAGSGGSAYDVIVRQNSTINPDRVATNNFAHTFGNLSFESTADNLRVLANSQHRVIFGGTNALNLPNTTTFDVVDGAANAALGGAINSTAAITTRAQITGGAGIGVIKTGSGKWQASSAGQSMTFGGGTQVEQGSLLFEYNPTTAVAGTISFGSGPITIDNGGAFGVVGNAAGGAATNIVEVNNTVNIVGFGGGLHIWNNTANQNIRWTGMINLAAPLLIGNGGGANTFSNNPQYGAVGSNVLTIDQTAAGSRMIVLGGSRDMDFNGNIVDSGTGTAGNELVLQAQTGNSLFINGTANTYANGTRILAQNNSGGAPSTGRIEVAATSKLGTGNVIVEGGYLALNALTNVESGKTVTLTPGFGASGLLALRNMNPTQAQLAALIDPASRDSVIALSNGTATTEALDLGALGNGTLFLGASAANTTYGASTLGVGAGSTYRLGGGYSTLTIANPAGNILTGGNSLRVGSSLYNGGLGNTGGNLILNGANDYTGGTSVDFGGGTFTVSNANGLGTGPLTTWSGTTTLGAPQSVSSVTLYGGTVNVNVAGALGASNSVTIGAGSGLAAGPSLVMNVAGGSLNDVSIVGNAFLRPNVPTTINNALNYAEDSATLSVAGQSVLILNGGPAIGNGNTAITASASGRAVNTALAVTNMNQIAPGNLNLNGGVLILDNTGLAGRKIGGSGPGEIQISTALVAGNGTNGTQTGTTSFNQNNFVGGGFAARGTPLVISNSDVLSTSAFDRDFTLGSAVTVNGQLYANAPVTLVADAVLSARRVVTIGRTGPGLTRQNTDAGVVINQISGNFSGTGSLTFRSNMSTNVAADPMAEVVLSGALTYTGSPTEDTDGGGASRWISAGPGGLIVSTGSSNPPENGDIFVRFNGQTSLPSGNGGTSPAYIFANRYAGTGAVPYRTGVLFTGDTDGESYRLNTGYRLALNGNNGTGAPLGATFGSTGGSSTLRDSQIALIGGLNTSTAAASTALLVRDGSFTLGDGTGAVRFQSANFGINTADNSDPGLASAATGLTDNTGARTIIARGMGSAIVSNVAYRNVADGGDTSGQFTWQLGNGTAGVAEGFVRESDGSLPTGSLSNVKVVMNGGVLELGANPRAINLGTGVGQIAMTGAAGGGFAASGGDRTVNIGDANAMLTWGGTGATANFLTATAPLILGSAAADGKVIVSNPLNLNGGARTIATIDGSAAVEAELSGSISGSAGSIMNIGAVNKPDGTPYAAGSVILSGDSSGYLGSTAINAGTVYVADQLGGTAVAVNAGGALGGDGTINAPVTVNAGGTLAPGNSLGTLDINSSLTFAGDSVLRLELGGSTPGLYDQVHMASETGSISLNSTTAIQLSLANGFNPNGSVPFFVMTRADAGTFSTLFAGTSEGGLIDFGGGVLANITYQADWNSVTQTGALTGGNDIALYNVVPEPGSAMMLLAGLGMGLGVRRFRRRA